jgi:O-antigen/teichoic acid export membrane protein
MLGQVGARTRHIVFPAEQNPVTELNIVVETEVRAKDSTSKHRRFAANLTSNLANFSLNILIGFWFTPYLIRHLGLANYGLIPLATVVVSYMSIFTLSINSSVSRFLTVALNRERSGEANRLFNTSLFSLLALAAVLLLFVLGGSLWVDKFLNVPPGAEQQVRILFAFAGVAFLINAVFAPFSVPAFSCNRLELSNFVAIVQTLARVGLVVALFALLSPQLWQIGSSLLLSALVAAGGGIFIWRSLAPELRIQRADFDWGTLKAITQTSGWVFLVQVGTILFLSIDLVVVNRLMGPLANGRYAAVLQWSTMLRGLAGTVAGIFTPMLLAHFARGDSDALVKDTRRAIKFLGIFIALPIGLICGFSRPLLTLWLGKNFTPLAPLMVLLVAPLSVNLAIMPLFTIALAKDEMRMPGIVSLVTGVLNLGLALLLCGPVGWGMYGVAAAGAIVLTGKNLIYMPLFAARLTHRPWFTFYREMGTITTATLIIGGLSWAFSSWLTLFNWPLFLAACIGTSLLYGTYVYFLALKMDERGIIAKMVSSSFRRG